MTLTSDPKPLYRIDFTKAHTRYKNEAGKIVPGVTTVLGIQAKPWLINWANNLGLEGIDCNRVRDDAADIGTIAHAMCECHVKGMDLDRSNLSPEAVDKAENAYIKFAQWWDREGLVMVHSELRLVSEFWQVGGTIDIIARDHNDDLVLIDLKTSKDIYKDYRVQTSAYASIYEELHDDPISRILIVRIGKEDVGDFEVREVFDRAQCVDHFTSLREAYRTDKLVKQ